MHKLTLFALCLTLCGAAHAQDAPAEADPAEPAPLEEAEAAPDPLAILQEEVAALRAREDIRELLHAYGRTLDTRNFAAFADLFTADAEYVGGPNAEPISGNREIAVFLRDIIASDPSGYGEPNRHVFFNEHIVVDGDTATGSSMSAFVVPGPQGPMMAIVARYEDDYVRQDGVWKFARRAVYGAIPGPPNGPQ